MKVVQDAKTKGWSVLATSLEEQRVLGCKVTDVSPDLCAAIRKDLPGVVCVINTILKATRSKQRVDIARVKK